MKYPLEQYNQLVNAIEQLSKYVQVDSIHPSNLHYIIYQQANEGQKHNCLYVVSNGELIKAHAIKDGVENYTKVINIDSGFKLYPDGCNDSHVETATKSAVKQVLSKQLKAT